MVATAARESKGYTTIYVSFSHEGRSWGTDEGYVVGYRFITGPAASVCGVVVLRYILLLDREIRLDTVWCCSSA